MDTKQRWTKQTVPNYISRCTKLDNGCWIAPTDITCRLLCSDGVVRTATKAVLFDYGKEYRYRIVRTCKNRQCINPDHLFSPSIEELFWMNVDIRDDITQCWEWKSYRGTNKYGKTKINGMSVCSHRVAYEFWYKLSIPDGMIVCHHCDNPPCCNPHHLFIGTTQDNVNDRERKGRNWLPRVKGENHGQHKLSELDVFEIRKLRHMGLTYLQISKKFPVSVGQIRNILKGYQWEWLK